MKHRLVILLIVELVIAYVGFAPTCIKSRDRSRAFMAWHDNPTAETTAEWHRQLRIDEMQTLEISTAIFGVMAGPTLMAAWVWSRKRPDRKGFGEGAKVA
jgi:hypothetical protein